MPMPATSRSLTSVRPFVVLLFFLSSGLAVASCRDDPTGPGFNDVSPRGHPRAESWTPGQGSLGSVSIPVPSSNYPNDGEISWITTGISIPDSSYLKVSIDGNISVSTHPDYLSIVGSHATHNGKTVGPWGISSNELRVRVEVLDSAGGLRFAYGGYPGTGADSAVSTVRKLGTGGSLRVMRKGVTGAASCGEENWDPEDEPGCWNGSYYFWTPAYNLSGAQNLQVETFDPFDFDDASGEIVEGTTVTASATPHANVDSLSRERWWFREGDTLATPIGAGGVWISACENQSECSYQPEVSGRFYLRTRVHIGSYQLETVGGDPVLLRDYVFDFEPDTVVELGDLMFPTCPSGSAMIARSCVGGAISGDSVLIGNVWVALRCDTGTQRGQPGGCEMGVSGASTNLPAPPAASWTFAPADCLFLNPVHDSVPKPVWQGVLAASGSVTAIFTYATASDSLTADLVVVDRTWGWTEADWSYVEGQGDATCPKFRDYIIDWSQRFFLGSNMRAIGCESGRLEPNPDVVQADQMVTAAEIQGGPNDAQWFVESTARFTMDRASAIHPDLTSSSTPIFTLNDPADQAACGTLFGYPPYVTTYQYNVFCRGFPLDTLTAAIFLHEGFGTAGIGPVANGHEARGRWAASLHDPYDAVETLVGPDSVFIAQAALTGLQAVQLSIGTKSSDHHFVNGHYEDLSGCKKVWAFTTQASWNRFIFHELQVDADSITTVCI